MSKTLVMVGLALLSIGRVGAETQGKPSPYRALQRREEPSSTVLPASSVLPAGSVIKIRLNHSVGTKLNRPGERFDATLVSPLMVNGQVVAPAGADVHGIVRESRPSGRLKGRAVLTMGLESIEIGVRRVPLQTVSQTRTSDRHRRRNFLFTGGGAGTGALIGALAAQSSCAFQNGLISM